MQMKNKILPLVIAIPLIATGTAHAADEQIVKIGHVGPVTGPSAHLGKDMEDGAKMAIEELNAKGIVLGGKKTKFVLLTEDDASDPKQGTAAAQKLVDAKIQGVIGHMNSGTTIPASKIYYDAGTPQISPGATNPKYTQQGFNSVFRVVANDSQLGGTLGRYAATTLHAKNVAVVDDRTAYGQGLAQEFTKAAKNAGINVVATQFTNDKATDFNAILTSIKAKNPDVIFFGGMDAVAGPMLRQMKQLGIKAKLMGGDAICTTDLPKLAGDGIGNDQVVCAEAGGVEESDKKGLDDFKAAFLKKYNNDVKLYAPYSYDSIMTLVTAMQKANSADPKKYLSELAKIHYKGVTGMIAFDTKGDIKNGTLSLYTYKDSKRTLLTVTR